MSIGDRWCSVNHLLSGNAESTHLFNKFAFNGLDSKYSFSACNLKAIYILDEDFIDNGSALVLFSLVGSKWNHVVRVTDQIEILSQFNQN